MFLREDGSLLSRLGCSPCRKAELMRFTFLILPLLACCLPGAGSAMALKLLHTRSHTIPRWMNSLIFGNMGGEFSRTSGCVRGQRKSPCLFRCLNFRAKSRIGGKGTNRGGVQHGVERNEHRNI